MNYYDFSRSFIKWTSTRVSHTPRLQVEAACRVIRAGRRMDFFLSAACAGEAMYAPRGLIHQPAYEFTMICGRDGHYMFMKCHADEALNVAEAHRVGEMMSTQDGRGAAIVEMTAEMRRHGKARELQDYDEIRDAILRNRTLNARTEFRADGGRTRVVMDYPVKVCNVSHTEQRWQIDTGPVLLPDPRARGGLAVQRMRVGYIVFNSWDWAEVAIRALKQRRRTRPQSHFLRSVRLECRNRIFLVG